MLSAVAVNPFVASPGEPPQSMKSLGVGPDHAYLLSVTGVDGTPRSEVERGAGGPLGRLFVAERLRRTNQREVEPEMAFGKGMLNSSIQVPRSLAACSTDSLSRRSSRISARDTWTQPLVPLNVG